MKAIGCQNWFYLAFVLLNCLTDSLAEKQKRQIFREQVLPALGGKIPEDAFRTDRLALNRLNKEGISVPDGVVLDARHVQKHPHAFHGMAEVIKVYLTPDGRYVPPEGRYHYNHPKAVDTTYVIRKPYTQTNHHKYNNNYAPHKHRAYGKPQTYSNYRQYVPILPPPKAGVYKPIVTPLVIPGNTDLLEETYLPSWNVDYDWDAVYQPFDDYFANNIALFNSHQIISDYQGFLNQFHERSSRHVGGKSSDRNQAVPSQNGKQDRRLAYVGSNPLISQQQSVGPDVSDTQHPLYPNLAKIPETRFSCRGRKGMFADLETKCQVFHNCSGWSRTSSLCPPGTAFSEAKKRCEWWNTVVCKG